ncbi:hypothetical protein TNCV_2468691 [Trichonephila clavipes]|nr:hypothetical protein TNCV_2468691 [Trichonephila clavipes]
MLKISPKNDSPSLKTNSKGLPDLARKHLAREAPDSTNQPKVYNIATLKPVKQKNRVKSGHRPFSPLTLLQHVEFTHVLTFFPTCSDFWLDFPPVVRMACEIKLLESEATTGFFVLLGEQGNKAVLD